MKKMEKFLVQLDLNCGSPLCKGSSYFLPVLRRAPIGNNKPRRTQGADFKQWVIQQGLSSEQPIFIHCHDLVSIDVKSIKTTMAVPF